MLRTPLLSLSCVLCLGALPAAGIVGACSSSSGTTGAGGTGGSPTTSSTTTGSTTSSSSTGGTDGGADGAAMDKSCGDILSCSAPCMTSACSDACLAEGTPTAQALFNALTNCIDSACPSTDGGPCAMAGNTCSGCEQSAAFGTCGAEFGACEADKSNLDGGPGDGGIVSPSGGTITVLADGLSQPQGIAVQGDTVYFTKVGVPGAIESVPTTGGTVTTLASNQGSPNGIVTDAQNVYWDNGGTFSGTSTLNNHDGAVVQMPISGSGAPIILASGLEYAYNSSYLDVIAVDQHNVYWVAGASGTDGVVQSAPIGGGQAPTTLYSGRAFPQVITTDGVNVYWADWGTFDANGNYNNDGKVLQGPVGGGTVTTLATAQLAPLGIAVDAHNVYWTNAGSIGKMGLPPNNAGSVMQVPIGGGTVTTLATAQDIPLGIAVQGTNVVWVNWGFNLPGTIASEPIGGGAITTLVSSAPNPYGIVVVGTTIYWTDCPPVGMGNGAVLSYTPP